MSDSPQADIKRKLRSSLHTVRDRTFVMTNTVSDEDLVEQFDPLMSPLVWDMGHIANFEEFWLLRELGGREAHDAARDAMYNPFDNPRWVRGDLPLLDRQEATEYLNEVRHDVDTVLGTTDTVDGPELAKDGFVFAMTIQHEAQHQETILQALNLRSDLTPYELMTTRRIPRQRAVEETERVRIEGGSFAMGTDDRISAYDNERPSHDVHVDTFEIDRFPVTNHRYATFIKEGGYQRSELWSSAGWSWREEVDHEAPQGWHADGEGGWTQLMFGTLRTLDPAEPVIHVSFWEAEALANFEGGRLPTEAEWEKAASFDSDTGNVRKYPWGNDAPTTEHANLGQLGWGPAPIGSYPLGASAYGVEQLLGDVYEWTSSRFLPYPGYSTFPYAEYSEVFFSDENFRVLRGASWATAPAVARNTFRNWDYRQRRQILAGIRLAWDVT
ncbi:MAG: ergothioneine biosynthesis protein EgtB [Acidimicrobiia bacterium]|nr:MAG: ergothioneine biosynthesis protein EgtB [Acidimicrobiia bacterium]